jgi:23S rRNA pseudouridine1911/1915/1917 synthase
VPSDPATDTSGATTTTTPQRFGVESAFIGKRLDLFLAARVPEMSRSRLKALIASGEVLVNGAPAKAALLLKGGEEISLTRLPPRSVAALAPEALPLAILFEDDELLVVDKAAGQIVHPGAGIESGTLVNAILAHCPDLPGIGGERRPGIVHRLDKDTSGCLVVAKREQALVRLQAQFKAHSVDKRYLAIAHGDPGSSGRFDTLHGRHPTDRLRFTARVSTGRQAITEWQRLERFDGASLLEVRILTGRTHQIRMHLSEAGHPLLRDALYGAARREKKIPFGSTLGQAVTQLGRHALHAARLTFEHPRTGERLSFEAPLPDDFAQALTILRGEGG